MVFGAILIISGGGIRRYINYSGGIFGAILIISGGGICSQCKYPGGYLIINYSRTSE